MRIAAVGLAGVTAVAFAGCSLGLTPAPTTPPTSGPVECTDSYGPPVADTVGAVFFGVPALMVMGIGLDENESEITAVGALVFGLPTLLYILAARYGYRTAKRCFDAKDGNYRAPLDYGPEIATAEEDPDVIQRDSATEPAAEPTEPTEPTEPEAAPTEPVEPAPATEAGTLDADTLFAELDVDPAGATKSYWQRSLRVAGTVELVARGQDQAGLPYVTLVGKHPLRAVQCFFRDAGAFGGLRKGDRARLTGVFQSARVNVILLDCAVAPAPDEEPTR